MTMIFTRYLYNYNDAKYSLILAILKGSDFNEILFWADEIYHSGFKDELWQLLIKFYLDFCYINQYLYSKTIVKSYKDWKEKNDFKSIIKTLKHLHNFNKNYSIFKLRINNQKKVSTEKIKAKKNNKFTSKLQYLLLDSLKKKNMNNVCYYMNKMEIGLIRVVIDEYNEKLNVDISVYNDKKHILISVICLSMMKNKMKYENYRVNKSDIKFINDNNNIKGMKLYRVLKNKRLYGVNSEVGCFDVKREDIAVSLREKWEYYAYKSPIWKKRFDKYKVKVDDKKKKILFSDEDEYDDFYEKYNYEPDEQDKETQYKSIKDLDDISMNEVLCDDVLDTDKKVIY